VTELGFDTEDEASPGSTSSSLPLRQVDVEAGTAPMPAGEPDRERGSGSAPRARHEREAARVPHHAEADEAAAAANVTWPSRR
jgi:hypothetical protein